MGTSMKMGRRVSWVISGAGTPSSRNSRAMRLGQVLPPQAPMPARVPPLSSLRSRTPARMRWRISPAVTRSQRQTISSSSRRLTVSGMASPTQGCCTRMPAICLAMASGARTFTSTAWSANLGARVLTTGTLPSTWPRVSSTVTLWPASTVVMGNSYGIETSASPTCLR